MIGQVGVQLKPPVSAVPQGSGQGAHDPGNEPQTGVDGPESQECSAPVDSNGKGEQQLPGVPEHKPTSEDREVEVKSDFFLQVARSLDPALSLHPSKNLPFEAQFPLPLTLQALRDPTSSPEGYKRNDPR